MSVAPVVAMLAAGDAQRDQALVARLSLPLVPTVEALPKTCVAYLSYGSDPSREDHLQLFPADPKQSGPICVDFANDAAAHRLQSGGELIVKAVKGRGKNSLRVIDATAGLGRDSFVLAAHGFEVMAVERNAVVAALLDDGLRRVRQAPVADIAARIGLVHADTLNYLKAISHERMPDVVYLDPMFAHQEKAALVKKDMRLFRQLLAGDACDEPALLSAARAAAKLRVVVKRAIKAPWLADVQPSYTLSGKAVRFDIYVSDKAPAN